MVILRQICQSEIKIRASSRTDSGVHARGQVATIEVPRHIPLQKLFFSINSLLPDDVSVSEMVEVPADFNARRDNIGKRYIYNIFNSPVAGALHSRYTHWIRSPLDLSAMQAAANLFPGTHDFSAFRGKGCQQYSTTKTVQSVSIGVKKARGYRILQICVEGSGFLKNMVRIMAGTLVDIGRGKFDPEAVQRALTSGKREDAGLTAPAKGLILDSVFFDPDPFLHYQTGDSAVDLNSI